ncbi:MAG TPA: phosphoadenylyl-sulfate reductase, partial [Frankiaceae bacterium]|nr:phosphoadenylyl-sulfate reductase [Frankiaceae bacterium]
MRLEPAQVAAAAARLADRPAHEVLGFALSTFGRQFAVVTSFQLEGIVVIDLARRLDPGVRVVTLDTGRLPQETYDMMEEVHARFGVEVEVVAPDAAAVAAMTTGYGPNLFRREVALRRLCCHVRKVEPLGRALAGLSAWASGLRRDGGPARSDVAKVELDRDHGGLVKVNPLADWTRERVWAHAREHRLPVHPLYERGYASIGCAPCTRPVRPGEDERAGRWWWESDEAKECGLH